MNSSSDFDISLHTLRSLATAKSFERGEQYYHQGAIANPIRIGAQLQADCWGSERYHASITLSQDGIDHSSCTCPYNFGGLCKHRVALVLTHLRSPEKFTVIEDLGALLAEQSQAELVELVAAIVAAHPEIVPILIQHTQPEAPNPEPESAPPQMHSLIRLDSYRQQIQYILEKAEYGSDDYYYSIKVAGQLHQFDGPLQRFQQQEDWVNCARLCALLIEEMNAVYDDDFMAMDHDGDIVCTLNDWCDTLQTCFTHATSDRVDPTLREGWLQIVLETYFKELEFGGIDYGAASTDILIQMATDAEWAIIETGVMAELARVAAKESHAFSKHWRQEALVQLLQSRLIHRGDTQAAHALIKRQGTPEQKVWVWLAEEDFSTAIAAMEDLLQKGMLVRQVADELIKVNRKPQAVQLVQDAQAAHPDHSHLEWLSEYYQREQDWPAALEAQAEYVKQGYSFSAKNYQKLQQIAQTLDCWPETQSQLLKFFHQKEKHQTLMNIALIEQEWDEAIRVYEQALSTYERVSMRQFLAESLASHRPDYAIALYEDLTEEAINQRGRKAYARAAIHLLKTKTIYETMQRLGEWDAYVKQLRQTYKRLPALQDELNKVLR